jgi:hypothetical protein
MIPIEFGLMIFSGVICEPTPRDSRMETMFISSFWRVFERRSTHPTSWMKFPNASMPISGAAGGRSRIVRIRSMIGNIIFSVFETGRSCGMVMRRSFFVVSSFMIGGWMSGTRAMYEYAATATTAIISGASFPAT